MGLRIISLILGVCLKRKERTKHLHELQTQYLIVTQDFLQIGLEPINKLTIGCTSEKAFWVWKQLGRMKDAPETQPDHAEPLGILDR